MRGRADEQAPEVGEATRPDHTNKMAGSCHIGTAGIRIPYAGGIGPAGRTRAGAPAVHPPAGEETRPVRGGQDREVRADVADSGGDSTALTCEEREREKGARASAAGAPIGWVIGAREPQTPATEARILRRERLRQPRQTPAEPRPTLFNARKPAKVHR
jgi:hypothetical protein